MEVPVLATPRQGHYAEALDSSPGTAVFLGRFSEQGQPLPLRLVLSEAPAPVDQGYPPCYCITGHGRSGTSLVAAMLESGGLSIGKRLMGPHEGNVRGHFEDLDFYDFHVAVLRSQALHDVGYVLQPSVRVQEQFLPAAQTLVAARRAAGQPWGWKDPRAVLFLDFWQAQVPELRFILLFRSPWEVIDSLFRRDTDALFRQNPNFAVKVWENYNRALLDFHERFPRRCLLIESHAAAVAPHRLRQAIATRFGHHFAPLQELFDRDLFTHKHSSQLRSVLSHFFPAARDLYYQLRARATLIHRSWDEPPPQPVDAAEHDWALQHWVDFRVTEKTCKRLQAQVPRLEAELAEARTRAEQLAAERDRIARSAEAARSRSAEAARSLAEQLSLCQQRIAWMETSHFWRLRQMWLRMKARCRLG